jgi:hypothetical protein
MADFYPLIARAVLNLSNNTPAARQRLYERARELLADQMGQGSELEGLREQLALEMAIQRIEENALANQPSHRSEPEKPTAPEQHQGSITFPATRQSPLYQCHVARRDMAKSIRAGNTIVLVISILIGKAIWLADACANQILIHRPRLRLPRTR